MVPFAPEASRALVFAVVRAGCVGEGLSVGLFHFSILLVRDKKRGPRPLGLATLRHNGLARRRSLLFTYTNEGRFSEGFLGARLFRFFCVVSFL